ncbi:MAG: HRDC domain-containing protein [Gammaproteobacteria bacterium]|nr:HRDC domain-containing protein [Gammaproteobacteria bacterium]
MKFRFFTIPIYDNANQTDELNGFLGTHTIVSIKKTFVENADHSVWSFCIGYDQTFNPAATAKPGKIDYRAVLSDSEFQIYAKLRALRKELATQEGVPPYALFNNQQLASMVQLRVDSKTAMREISGIGESRVEKYGDAFLKVLLDANHTPLQEP